MAEDPYASIAQAAPESDPYASIATAPQTPGYFKEALAGVGRAVSGLASLPRQLMTPHETFGATREQEVKMGPVGRLLYNPVADVTESMMASEAARKTAAEHGEGVAGQALAYGEKSVIGPIVKKAEEAGPGYAKFTPQTAGAVTEGSTTFGVAPKVAEETLGTIGKLRKKVKAGLQPFARQVTGVEPAVKEAVKSAAVKHEGAVAKHEAATQTVAERGDLAKKVDEGSLKLREQIGKVEERVSKEADTKFDAVREKIGNPVADPAPLVEAVKSAEENILQNIPENIKEFRVILGHEAVPGNVLDAAEQHGIELGGQEPMTWDKLQSLKSRIDARLRKARAGARLNGDVMRSLYSVNNAIVETMGKIAEEHSAGALWADAKNFYRQFKEDFHEPSGKSGSGSPVAQSLNAVDPKNIRQPFVAKQATTGNRAVDILRKYPKHGGTEAAATAEELLGHHEAMRRIPDKAAPKPPEAPTVDVRRVAQDAIATRAKNWGSFNARDVGILSSSVLAEPIMKFLGGTPQGPMSLLPVAALTYEGGKYAFSRALNNPSIIEWLSRTPQEEAAVLLKIPGADKIKIVDGLTQSAIQSGKPVRLSPQAAVLLGPANVAKIVAAGGAIAGSQVNNRKDALTALGR